MMVQIAATTFELPFLFHQEPFTCPSTIDDCHSYVCSLPPEQQMAYTNPHSTSLPSRFGNYRCEMGGTLA